MKGIGANVSVFALFLALYGAVEAQEQGGKRHEVRLEGDMLSVALDRVPAKEVFQTIAETGKISILLDETLLEVPLTEEFEKLSLEEGLRRLIQQLQTDNFLISYVAEPSGQRRIVGVEILAHGGSGTTQEFGSVSIEREEPVEIPKGLKKQMEKGLNPGQLQQLEQAGSLPGTHIPPSIQEKLERGEELAPGQRLKLERALRKQKMLEALGSPEASKGAEVPKE